jgi:hypothetical protein
MNRLVVVSVLLMMCGLGGEADARRESLTPQQKGQLQKVQRIYVEALALTDKGQVDAAWIQDMATRRLQALGYTVTTDAAQPHDVHVKIKCEQRKVWEGTTSSGGDADLPDSPLRAWKGPACQLTYILNGRSTQWKKEVRTEFVDAIQAAAEAKAADPGAYALDQLKLRLEEYDFPVRLTADWNQDDRLLTVLADPKTPPTRKARIISLLGEMFSEKAVPELVVALKEPDSAVAAAAALALGNIGHQQSVTSLVEMLKAGSSEMRIAAARALGKVGALHGDASIVPPLLDALNSEDLAFKTEVVWALGQLPDRRSYEPLLALQRSLRNVRTSDRGSQEGKLWDAVSYSLKQVDGFDQIN